MKWVFYFLTAMIAVHLFPSLGIAQIYNVSSSRKMHSSADVQSNSNIIGSLPRGSKIKVLEVKPLPSGAQALRIQIMSSLTATSEKNSTEPQWIIRRSDADYVEITSEQPVVKNSKTEGKVKEYCADCNDSAMKKSGNQKDLGTVTHSLEKEVGSHSDLREMIRKYSESVEVEATLAKAKKLFGRTRRASLKCYRAVKEVLAASPHGTINRGLIPGRFDDEAALNAKNKLKDFGFINLLDSEFYSSQIKDASDAPKGSVLVYSSGKRCDHSQIKDCGHVEIKMGEPGSPGYISDFYSAQPITKFPNYKLVGVMIKPMGGTK